MGRAQRAVKPGDKRGDASGWGPHNPGSSGQFERFLDGGEATRFQSVFVPPSFGDRFGQLTVVGDTVSAKSDRKTLVQCDCGAEPYRVSFTNLRKGKSTRCNPCAKLATAAYRKMYYSYAADLPDGEHRRRLLNRFSSAMGRCHNPKSKQFPSYGGRGITVWEGWHKDRGAFLRYVQTLPGWDQPELEMDRRDCDGNYEPGNLRFITKQANSLNKRKVNDKDQELIKLREYVEQLEQCLRSCRCGSA